MHQKTYLVAFIENRPNPAIVLRGTTSHSRPTLKINQPGKLFVVAIVSWLNWGGHATNAACEQSQTAFVWLAVVNRDIEEQLCHAKPPWIGC